MAAATLGAMAVRLGWQRRRCRPDGLGARRTGHGVAGIVIIAESDSALPDKHAPRAAIMDQQHMQFVPGCS